VQGDPPHSTSGTITENLADHAVHRQADLQPIFKSDQDLGKLTVTATTTVMLDARSAHTYILSAESARLLRRVG
jgi:uncharacterized protein YjiK